MKKSENSVKPKYPLVFVTGIGQTWTTMKGSTGERWNLFPCSGEVLLHEFGLNEYCRFVQVAAKSVFGLLTGFGYPDNKEFNRIIDKLFYACITDADGHLPGDVDVRIYGARSFDVLRKTEFHDGALNEGTNDSLLSRLYRDIPCQELADEIGEENLYCFNYSPFFDIYDNARNLREMIRGVIADQRKKTGADKVILIPMSMGATVVTAYLDLYYDENGAVGDDLVSKIISIVGAWNGSDALADLLALKLAPDFDTRLAAFVGKDTYSKLKHINPEKAKHLAGIALNSVFESLLLRSTCFMALIPCERYNELAPGLFSYERLKRNPHLAKVKKRAEKYHNAQINLRRNMESFLKGEDKGVYFISGYNMDFGEQGRDFDFLSLISSARTTNSDSVIQISSTAPGTAFVKKGETFPADYQSGFLSPEKSIDASTCWFPESAWYFEGQQHELGTNNTALRLAGDIALGKVNTVRDCYPQFNKKRDLSGVNEMLERADRLLADGNLPENKAICLQTASEQVKLMKENIVNDPDTDDRLIGALKKELDDILK